VFVALAIIAVIDAKADDPAVDEEKQARAKEILEHMQGIGFERITSSGRQAVALIDQPLLKYTDPVRANDQGTVWAWGREGRPLAVVEVFKPGSESKWVHAATLTSTDLIVATVSPQLIWSPQTTSIEFQTIKSAPRPADKVAQRLGQLKDLARRFEACEYWDSDNSRYELRLLV
jgi:hypothetical protein